MDVTGEEIVDSEATEPPETRLVGYLHGERANGTNALVCVYRDGLEFRLSDAERSITCLPSVVDIEGVKLEATRVYRIWRWVFEPSR